MISCDQQIICGSSIHVSNQRHPRAAPPSSGTSLKQRHPGQATPHSRSATLKQHEYWFRQPTPWIVYPRKQPAPPPSSATLKQCIPQAVPPLTSTTLKQCHPQATQELVKATNSPIHPFDSATTQRRTQARKQRTRCPHKGKH